MEKKKIKGLAAGSIALGALGLISNPVNAENLFTSTDLGTGAELRSDVLALNNATQSIFNNTDIELKCGEGKCGEEKKKAEGEKAEGKSGEAKCGEGKCGEEKKAEGEKKEEGKSGEAKCGEGKCGEGKCGQ